jgi:cytidyltransferase-like protein
MYSHINSRITSLISAVLIFFYQTLDAIDGKHARRTKNSSPLGEIFDHGCDAIGTLFILLTISTNLGITHTNTLFYITQSGMILFLMEHIKAFKTGVLVFNQYDGPGELIITAILILLWKAFIGWIPSFTPLGYLFYLTAFIFYWVCYLHAIFHIGIDKSFHDIITTDIGKLFNINYIKKLWIKDNHYGTKVGLLLCLAMRCINGVLLWYGLLPGWELADVIAHGLVLSVIITDMIVAKMAKRELHPIIVLGSLLTIFNHNIMIYTLVILYYLRILYEISDSMGISIFTPSKNVYICGVWDLLHLGHMKHFQEVSQLGNRLLVGVHNDEEVTKYKRIPTLSMEERATTASMCKGVSKVIKNAPMVLTKEFITDNNIHVVACSSEYDSSEDVYYKVPREMGILKVIPRIEGISTSEILERVKSNHTLESNSKDDDSCNDGDPCDDTRISEEMDRWAHEAREIDVSEGFYGC